MNLSKIKSAIFDRGGTLNCRSPNRYLLSSNEILWPEDMIKIQKLIASKVNLQSPAQLVHCQKHLQLLGGQMNIFA